MSIVTAAEMLTNATGLHARPAVKLTGLAKSFAASVEIAVSPDGPWSDAKSPVRVMRVRAPQGTLLHMRASGVDAQAAVDALCALARARFGEDEAGATHG